MTNEEKMHLAERKDLERKLWDSYRINRSADKSMGIHRRLTKRKLRKMRAIRIDGKLALVHERYGFFDKVYDVLFWIEKKILNWRKK